MEKTTYQQPELRNNLDAIVQAGSYGKNTAFCNRQNTGILDYINNNLEALKGTQDSQATTVAGKVDTTTYNTKMTSLDSSITALQTSVSGKVDTSTYNTKMTSIDGDIETLSSGKAPLDSPAFTTKATLDDEDILTEGDVLTLEEIEASTSLADTDVASASALKKMVKIYDCEFTPAAIDSSFSCPSFTGYRPICVSATGRSAILASISYTFRFDKGTHVVEFQGTSDIVGKTLLINVVYLKTSLF